MGVAQKMVSLFHGKSQTKMDDDWGYPNFRKPPIPWNTPRCAEPGRRSWTSTVWRGRRDSNSDGMTWWLDGLFWSSEIWVEFYTEKQVMFCQTLCLHEPHETNKLTRRFRLFSFEAHPCRVSVHGATLGHPASSKHGASSRFAKRLPQLKQPWHSCPKHQRVFFWRSSWLAAPSRLAIAHPLAISGMNINS